MVGLRIVDPRVAAIGGTAFTRFVVALILIGASGVAHALTLHVSPSGDDAWSGLSAAPNTDQTDGPLQTLTGARDRLRSLRARARLAPGEIRVVVHAGEYALGEMLAFTSEDGGSEESPVTWAAHLGDDVVVTGGRRIPRWAPLTDAALLERLPEAARGKVFQADLRALGVNNFGSADGSGLMLYYEGAPMTMARWPNEDFTRIVEEAGGDKYDIRGTKGDRIGKWVYDGDRPSQWTGQDDVWVHGYWFWDWSDQRHRVKRIDGAARTVEVEEPYHHYGYRKGQWYYFYNVFDEIDTPGEWYLDRDAGMLYFWPPDEGQGDAFVSVLDQLVSIQDASHLRFDGIRFEGARRRAIEVSGGESVAIANCTLRNIGGDAVAVRDGRGHVIRACTMYHLGGGGLSLSGGDRETLTPSRHQALDNHIHAYGQWYRMYHPAISINGVGQVVSGNYIHDAPHMAIQFGGNDHVIEHNEIHDVCLESNDAGAIYAGRDWTMRGTVIRNNYLHNITGFRDEGCVGVYLDDMFCGTRIENNLFFRVTRAAFIGGGRDNVVRGNVFVDCRPALHVDDRALNWAAYVVPTTMTERLNAMPYRNETWRERYPELSGILDDQPAAPQGNIVEGNLFVGGRWDEISGGVEPMLTMRDNTIMGEEPLAPLPFRSDDSRPRATEFADLLQNVAGPEAVDGIELGRMDRRPR